ncbi:14881_t:CDS:2 [Cetraspora pellucida]|uniref:14881_t:CDS:1 n=1 Tax=Cetraspora pellucida TaxID=1433469 RepID=A0A9N8VR62_9GLOM|nr:14881_t:CDS:2 [Cetraspora pellucida]
MSTQPLAYIHEKEIVFVEQNNLPNKKNGNSFFSSFKVLKLKGPIDENLLYDTIFPQGKKYFHIETFNYTGESTKNATSKLKQFSENGLLDWFATDSMTLKEIYPSINDKDLPMPTTPQNDDYLDVSNYQIIDEERLRADIKALSEDLKLKRQNYPDNIFDQLFYDTFRRRDMGIRFDDLTSEFFSQLNSVHCLLGIKKDGYEGNDMVNDMFDDILCPDRIKDTIVRYMVKTLEYYLFESQFITINSIYESYQELKSADQSVKDILEEEKQNFRKMASNMESCVSNILRILRLDDGDDNILREQYKKLKGYLSLFCEVTISLLELVKYICIKCDEQRKKLEGQNTSLTTKLVVGACTLAVTVGAGILYAYSKSSSNPKDGKNKSLNTSISDRYATVDLQSTISRLTGTIKQLRDLHDQLKDWSFHGQSWLNRDYEEMYEYKSHLLSLFLDIKKQCKKLDLVLEY